jgi:hypothetical protein
MFRIITLLSSLLLAIIILGQTSLSLGPVIDVNSSNQGGLRPRITINGDGMPVVLWGRNSPNANRVAVGTGTGFTPGVQVHIPGSVIPAASDWQGSSIAAAGNTVWVVMKATPEDEQSIYVRRSDDGGLTWGDTIRVVPDNGLLSRFPVIGVSDPDRPVVQYMEFADGFWGARYVVTRMENGVFQEPLQVSAPYAPGNVCDCCPAQVVVQGEEVAALYRNAGDDERVMWGAFSHDGAASFANSAKIDTTGWIISQCMSSGPDGYITGDSLTYVWMSGAVMGSKAYVGRINVNDGGIGHHRRISSLPQSVIQNFPRIAGTGDTLGVVWQQSSGGQMEILFSWSTTGPDGLGSPDTINVVLEGMQRTPDIAYADGAFHIVWDEMGSSQVRYRKLTLESTVSIAEASRAEMKIWPNPTTGILQLQGVSCPYARITDLQGRTVLEQRLQDGTLDVSTLAAGRYVLVPVCDDPAPAFQFEKL